MLWILTAIAALAAGGLGALATARLPRLSNVCGAFGTFAGCAIGLVPVGKVLCGGAPSSWTCGWSVPFGSCSVELDPLSALFLLPILGLSALAAVYGREYLADQAGRKPLGVSWFFFNALVASMVLVVLARNAVLFLVAWELMSVSSFFLVTFDDEQAAARRAGWTYLVATHVGTAFLLALFVLLGSRHGTAEFSAFSVPAGVSGGVLFVLAVIGFGTKAGFMPLHVWLPEAHPAAPSHVSALMSGVMIKTGIYGLVRTLMFLGPPPPWWGCTLLGIGLLSGLLGVLSALSDRDLKRLLAYSTVENAGIVALGLGLGLLGLSYQIPAVAIAGLAGALLHVLNHAVFKGLLFLGAGAVVHATGTRELERLGGLLKRMPWTGAAFAVGAAAICGLPPLNGFVGEFLLYLGAFKAAVAGPAGMMIPALGLIIGLALIGGFAAVCFTRAFGAAFLGEPRTDAAVRAHEAAPSMCAPMVVLALACGALGFAAPQVCSVLVQIAGRVAGLDGAVLMDVDANLTPILSWVVVASAAGVVLAVGLVVLRRALLAGRCVATAGTWDCGYALPDARMQYTASSFSQPLTKLFAAVLGTRERTVRPNGLFPKAAAFASETIDLFSERVFRPLFRRVEAALARLRWLQQGRLQLYVLYIAVTLLVLLVWKL